MESQTDYMKNLMTQKKEKRRRKLLIIALTFVFWPGPVLLAQSASNVMLHQQLTAAELPAPLQPFSLEVTLRGIRDIGLDIRAYVVRDGRVMDLFPVESSLSDYGDAVYRFDMSAPIAETSYQFILSRGDGTFEISQRYSIRRNCIPDLNLTVLDSENSTTGQERLIALLQQTKGLERDIEQYERASQILQDIKELLSD